MKKTKLISVVALGLLAAGCAGSVGAGEPLATARAAAAVENLSIRSVAGDPIGGFDEHLAQSSGSIPGWTLNGGSYPALYDANVSHAADGSGSINLRWASAHCPIPGDPLTTPQSSLNSQGTCGSTKNDYGWGSHASTVSVPSVVYQRYTVTYWSKTNATAYAPVGELDVKGAGASEVIANVKLNTWERHDLEVVALDTSMTLDFYRMASTDHDASLWIDDVRITEGWTAPATLGPRRRFDGKVTKIDSNGNYSVLNAKGKYDDFFPWCMQGSRYQLYADNGWNCHWSVGGGTDAMSDRYWNGTGYTTQDFSVNSKTLDIANSARAVNPEFAPDGLKVMMDINRANRGQFWPTDLTGAACTSGYCFHWEPSYVTSIATAATNLKTKNGGYWNRYVFAWLEDAENIYDKTQRAQAVAKYTRASDIGGRPIIVNAGAPGAQNVWFANGTPLVDAFGSYISAHKGVLDSMDRSAASHAIASNYCQINPEPAQSGAGTLRLWVYECLGAGGKMISLWQDGTGAYGGLDVTATQWWADSKWLVREQRALWPLLKTQVPSWTPTSDSVWMQAWPRDYNGRHYLIVINEKDNATTATISANVAVKPGTVARDYFTKQPVGTFDAGGHLSLTLEGLNSSSAARGLTTTLGQDGGTRVLLIDDPSTVIATAKP